MKTYNNLYKKLSSYENLEKAFKKVNRDRVIHHAIFNIIEPIFDKKFIYDSYANRKIKGVHQALKRFDYFKRKISINGAKLNNVKYKNYKEKYKR